MPVTRKATPKYAKSPTFTHFAKRELKAASRIPKTGMDALNEKYIQSALFLLSCSSK
jgi:hypothetical protein